MGPELQKLPVVSVVMAPALRWPTAGVIRCPYSISDKATQRFGVHFGTIISYFASDDTAQAVWIASRTSWLVKDSVHLCWGNIPWKYLCLSCLPDAALQSHFLSAACRPSLFVPFRLIWWTRRSPCLMWLTNRWVYLDCVLAEPSFLVLSGYKHWRFLYFELLPYIKRNHKYI